MERNRFQQTSGNAIEMNSHCTINNITIVLPIAVYHNTWLVSTFVVEKLYVCHSFVAHLHMNSFLSRLKTTISKLILHCIMLYHIILYYVMLHYIILHYIISYYITLYYIILYYIILYHIILHHIISYYVILYYTILY